MAMPPGLFLLFGLNVLSAIVAFLTSYYAYRFNRMTDNPLLSSISIGFMLLGVGLVAEAWTSILLGGTLVELLGTRELALIATFTYLSIQMGAYLAFAIGYAFLAFGKAGRTVGAAAAMASFPPIVDLFGLYRYAVVSYFVVLVLLAFIVFQGALIHSRARNRFSLLVLLAFVLLLAAHAVLLISVATLSGNLFLFGASVQFLGFVSLLLFLLRSGRVGAG